MHTIPFIRCMTSAGFGSLVRVARPDWSKGAMWGGAVCFMEFPPSLVAIDLTDEMDVVHIKYLC